MFLCLCSSKPLLSLIGVLGYLLFCYQLPKGRMDLFWLNVPERERVHHDGEAVAWWQEQEADDHILINAQEAEKENKKQDESINP